MKKLSVVLAILLIAALAFGGWSFSQKGSLDKQVTDLKSQMDTKVSELTKAKDDAVAAAQTAADEAAAKLQEQITALTSEKEEAQKAADEAAAKLQEQITALTGEKEEAQKAIEAANATVADLEAQLAAANEDAATKTNALQTAAAEAAAKLQEQIAALTGDKEAAQKATEAANAVVADLEAKLAATAKDAETKAAAVQTAANEAAAKLQEQIAALTGDKDAAQKAAEAANALVADLEAKLAEAAKDAEAKLTAAQTAANEAAAKLQEQITALTGEKEEAQKAAETANASVAELQAKLAEAAKDTETKLAEAAKDTEAKLAEAQNTASEAAAKLQEQITALTGEKEAAQKAVETANAKVAELETKLADAAKDAETKAAAALADADAAAAAKAEEAAAALAALTAEKDDAQKALKEAADKAAALEGQLEEVKALMNGTYAGKTVILHSNDVHGAVDGYAYMAWLKDWFKGQGASVIAADIGDFSQGSIYVSTNKGAAAVDMMNAAGYDVITLGNHDLDFGYAQLMENLSKAKFNAICANIILDETGEPALPATYIYEANGLKIAFVGVETPETATKVHPGLIKEIHLPAFEEFYTCVQAAVDSVKDQADLVIALTHLGVDAESALNGYRSIDLLGKVTGIDFVLDGHSHTVMTAGENGEPIQSTGTKFANIGVVVIDNETKKIEKNFLYNTKNMPKDEAVAALAQSIMDEVDAQYGAVFATTEVELNGAKAPGNRTEETNLGDLITDALVWSVVKEGGIEQVEPNHVVGITNGGGIRATIPAGDVTMKDINTVLPFGNTVAVVYVTGNELLEVLEASTFCTPDPVGGFPQTSGIQWTLDTSKPFDQGAVYSLDGKASSYYAPASIQRVTIVSVNGEAFDPEATYAVVTNNFCSAGGDTYNAFAKSTSQFDTGIPMDQAVMAYITEVLNGKITAEAYGAPQGRETQLP